MSVSDTSAADSTQETDQQLRDCTGEKILFHLADNQKHRLTAETAREREECLCHLADNGKHRLAAEVVRTFISHTDGCWKAAIDAHLSLSCSVRC